MALETLVAGPYSAVFNSNDVGITENGFQIDQEASYQQVAPSDAYGDTVLDLIYRGGNVHVQYESKAYKTGSIAAAWPFAALGVLGTAGLLMVGASSPLAKVFIMTRRLTDSTPTTITANQAALAPNFPVRLLFDARLRTVPVRKMLLPYDVSGTIKFFVTA